MMILVGSSRRRTLVFFLCGCAIFVIFKDVFTAVSNITYRHSNTDDELVNNIMVSIDVSNNTDNDTINMIKGPTIIVLQNDKTTIKPKTIFIDHKPMRRVKHADCKAMFEGNTDAKTKAKKYMLENPHNISALTDAEMYKLAIHCDALTARGYIMDSLSEEEQDFPIAFSILMHKNVEQAETLLRLIYRPQNTYCIHIDMKSPASVHLAMQAVADCFDNVFIASKLEYIVYAGWPRLQAEFNCMKDSLERGHKWKYYINMVSEVFPLKTNAELVKILKIYNGTNDIEILRPRIDRYKKYYIPVVKRKPDGTYQTYINDTGVAKPHPPHGITIVKGSAYAVLTREFVEFMLSPDPVVQDFMEWSKETYSPDEHVFATLHSLRYNPKLNAPGGYNGNVYILL